MLVLLVLVVGAGGLYAHQRWVRGNFHEVLPGRLYRAAQPSEAQMARWIREHEFATVVNLRDDRDFPDEAAAVRAAGVRYLHLPLADGRPLKRRTLLALLDSLETLPRPLLIHCRAGADRTGTACVLAVMAMDDRSFEEARGQLARRYLHLDDDAEAVEGVVLRYAAYCERFGRDPGGWTEFRRWVRDHYSEAYYLVDIAAPDTIHATAGAETTVELVLRNRTDHAVPSGRLEEAIKVAAYAGSAVDMVPDREYPPRLPLPADIAPHDSLRVAMPIWSPAEPGVHEIRFDLLEESVTWFCAVGLPERSRVLVVAP